MNKRLKFSIILILLASMFLPLGMSAWVLVSEHLFQPTFVSKSETGLTKYIDEQSIDGTTGEALYIFDNGTTANSFTAISSDSLYDADKKEIYLGYPTKEIIITDNIRFTHSDAKIQYSESNYLNSTTFCTADGDATALYTYFSSNANETSNKPTTVYKNRQWINYYYNDQTYTTWENGVKVTKEVIKEGRLYTIKLVGDITISSGCVLDIGAFVGASTGANFAGPMIEGNFVALDLNGHTLTIENGATLNAYGYILDSKLDENGKHIGKIDNYGTIYSSFIVENYGGGGNTVATAAWGTAPFSYYSIPYLSCRTIFNYGSSLKCPTSLYPNEAFSKVVINMIGSSGSSSLIEINANSIVEKDSYNDPSINYTAALYGKNYKSFFVFKGDIDIKTLKLNISIDAVINTITKTINMAEFGFTLPPYVQVVVESGTTSLGMLVNFVPGSTLTVKKDATIEFNTLSLTSDETLSETAKTTDGGIRMLSQLPADSTYCYKGHSPGAGISAYTTQLSEEYAISGSGNTEARANIYGNVSVTATNSSHYLVGKINLYNGTETDETGNLIANNSYEQVVNNSSFSFFSTSYEYYAYISGSDLILNRTVDKIKDKSTTQVNSSYTILPLVSQGKVVNPSSISSSFNSDTYYDFAEGIYTCNNKTYAYMLSNTSVRDTSGSIVEVNHDSQRHVISYNNKVYSFYRNIFIENTGVNNDNVYVLDNTYTGFSTENYYPINYSSNSVSHTYKYTATGTTNTATFTKTRTRSRSSIFKSWGDWKDNLIDSNWTSFNFNWDDPTDIVEGTTKTETINYKLETVNISKYTYYYTASGIKHEYGDMSSYKENILYSLTRRPSNTIKFSQTMTSKYYQIGVVNLNYSYSEREETTDWMIDTANAKQTETGGGFFDTSHSQTYTTTGTQNINTVSAGTWSVNSRKMYVETSYSTYLRWHTTIGAWIKIS